MDGWYKSDHERDKKQIFSDHPSKLKVRKIKF